MERGGHRIKYVTNSKKGLSRDKNQDRTWTIEKSSYFLFILFDGVSSSPQSHKLIEEFKKEFKSRISSLDSEGNEFENVLYLSNKACSLRSIEGASTLSALFISRIRNFVKYVNIGDSRIYIFNNQFLEQITKDDSLEGQRNIITRYLGCKDLTINDFKSVRIDNLYNYLMCTDGFYLLMEKKIKEYFNTINYKHLKNIQKKIAALQRRMNSDDSTYIIIKNEL